MYCTPTALTDSLFFGKKRARGLRLVSISVNSEHFNLASKGADSQGHEELSHGHRQAPTAAADRHR